jgi:flavin-binding protein dodecin
LPALVPAAHRSDAGPGEFFMSNHVYKQVELVGSSAKSSDDAIARAIERASSTLRNLEWFEVTSVRGHVEDGRVAHWQVCLKIGMRIEEPGE